MINLARNLNPVNLVNQGFGHGNPAGFGPAPPVGAPNGGLFPNTGGAAPWQMKARGDMAGPMTLPQMRMPFAGSATPAQPAPLAQPAPQTPISPTAGAPPQVPTNPTPPMTHSLPMMTAQVQPGMGQPAPWGANNGAAPAAQPGLSDILRAGTGTWA